MLDNKTTYELEKDTYSTSVEDFSQEEIAEIKKDAAKNDDLYFLAVDWSASIVVIKYILSL